MHARVVVALQLNTMMQDIQVVRPQQAMLEVVNDTIATDKK